jgi:arsenate reductase (glutaredoxin)
MAAGNPKSQILERSLMTEWVVYGIKSCDSCKKLLKQLESEGHPHRFHDLRSDGLPEDLLKRWIQELSLEALLNRKSTTYRGLEAHERARLDGQEALEVLMTYPTLIKRPLLDTGDRRILAPKPQDLAQCS